jgi:hypothetical protein
MDAAGTPWLRVLSLCLHPNVLIVTPLYLTRMPRYNSEGAGQNLLVGQDKAASLDLSHWLTG